MAEHENTNRAFIQVFLTRNILTFQEAQPMLAAIFSVHEKKDVNTNDITQEDFDSMLSAANDALSPLDFEIRSTLHQETRERYYALVNTTSDALTQIATIHSTDEIGYVKRLLDTMFETNNNERREAMCIAGKEALNLARAGRRDTDGQQSQPKFNLTSTEAESLLSNLAVEGWLDKSRKGFYSLSPRALMELKGWLVETYNDEDDNVQKIKSCQACKEIITVVRYPAAHPRNSADTAIGTKMSETVLPHSPSRYLYPKLLPGPEIKKLPSMQDGMGWKPFCGRKSYHNLGKLSERKETKWYQFTHEYERE